MHKTVQSAKYGITLRRSVFVFISLLLFIYVFHGQDRVVIKERVEINPKEKEVILYAPPIITASTITYRGTLNGSLRPEMPHYLNIGTTCGGGQSVDFPGTVEVSYPVRSSFINGNIRFYVGEGGGQFVQTWSVDGTVVQTETFNIGAYHSFNGLPYFNLYEGFILHQYVGYIYNEETTISRTAITALGVSASGGTNCQPPGYNPCFGTMFTITRGAEYGQFVDGAGTPLGTSISCNSNEISDIGYAADGVNPATQDTIEVEAVCAGIVHTTSFIVVNGIFSIHAWVGEDTIIEYGNSVLIHSEFHDVKGSYPPPNILYGKTWSFNIIQGSEYGTLWDELTGQTGTQLSGIEPDDYYSGGHCYVKYIANGTVPETNQWIVIEVSSNDGRINPVAVTVRVVPLSQPDPCPVVSITPEIISPGGTASISIDPYPAGQVFYIWMTTDKRYGRIRSIMTGEESWYLCGVQPFEFIAAENIDVDSTVVEIVAWPLGGGGSSSISSEEQDTLVVEKQKSRFPGENRIEEVNLKDDVLSIKDVMDTISTPELPIDLIQRVMSIIKSGTDCNPVGRVTIKDSLGHFEVSIVPDTASIADTLAYTEGASLFIQAKDKDGDDFEIDTNTAMKFSLLSNEEYGTFIAANGDTLKTTPVQLSNVSYGDAKAGRIKFAAVKKNPDSLVTCRIRVEKLGDTTKYGERDAIIIKKTVISLTVAHWTLKPLGNSDNKDNPNLNINGDKRLKIIDFSKVNKTTVTVTIKRGNNKPLMHYPFSIKAFVRDSSGGHDHTANRPTGKFITHSNDTLNYFSDTTDSDGMAIYDYLCSGFGGIDSIRVQGSTVIDTFTATILLKMGDFEELTTGAHYQLVGETTEHRKNHYGTTNLVQKLKALSDSMYARTKDTLRINDMSLIWGGPFDCDTSYQWDTPHITHRQGTNTDISYYSPGGIRISDKHFRDLVKKLKGEIDPHGHYHTTFK